MATIKKTGGGGTAERIDRRGLAQQVAARTTGVTEAQMYEILGAFGEVVTENLQHGVAVNLAGFGTWKPTDHAARMGRDVRTQQPIQIPARRAANFSAGSNLKTALSGSLGGGGRARTSGSGLPKTLGATASAAPPSNTADRGTGGGRGRGGGRQKAG
jgi:DNA-binding protein HU-beta